MGDRVAVLRDGVLQQCAVPRKLYRRPENVFVAEFIGSPAMNLFEGSLRDDGVTVRLGSQNLVLSKSAAAAHPTLATYHDKPIVVGIRPEDLPVVNGATPQAVLQGDVELVEALGSEQLVHFRTDARVIRSTPGDVDGLEQAELSDDLYVARIGPRVPVSVGARISFAVAPERIEFFDPSTGVAIRN